jgi:hypothetical protein
VTLFNGTSDNGTILAQVQISIDTPAGDDSFAYGNTTMPVILDTSGLSSYVIAAFGFAPASSKDRNGNTKLDSNDTTFTTVFNSSILTIDAFVFDNT